MKNTTSILADFITKIRFQDIPKKAVEEAKRLLLDSIGCAMAGLNTEKGKIALLYAKRFDAKPEATIIGSNGKVSSPMAAFVNGELFNALDFDPLFSPLGHVTPYVLSAVLSLAELKKVSGNVLITAIVLAHEIAQRIASGLVIPNKFAKSTTRKGIIIQLPVHGYSVNIFGGIGGAAKILGLSKSKIEHAMGIAGYWCPVPTLMQFVEAVPSSMTKFSPAGWLSQTEVTAAFLSEMGYTGDKNVLDGEYGFWKSFAAEGWQPEYVINGLGDFWSLADNMVNYKRYPCCGAMHGVIDILDAMIKKFSIKPEDIKGLNVNLNLLAELSLWKNREINTHIEAQFSAAYVFSVVCHQIEVGHKWQLPETYTNVSILELMKRVSIATPASPDYENRNCMVEIFVEDKETKRELRYTERDVRPVSFEMSEQELFEKFKYNAEGILSSSVTDRIIKTILTLDQLEDVSGLMDLFVP
ncbi:MmgE/PrpD family protein [delta proteobacterium NaphS2]|nr:MmgE/PrpD family protein [delta proteobacterium NaphS2]